MLKLLIANTIKIFLKLFEGIDLIVIYEITLNITVMINCLDKNNS